MRLDQVSAVLRPRSNEEAADLGLALIRRHAGGIFKAWFLLLGGLWGLLLLALHDYPSVMVFLAWWLKPLYDRVVIFYLGHALFGDIPGLRAQLRAWPRLLTRNLLPDLLWRRISTVRSFVLPVSILENQGGKAGRQREAILKRYGGPAATAMTSGIGLLELAVLTGALMGLKPFIPEEWLDPITSGSLLSSYASYAAVPLGLLWSVASCYLLAIALVEPFYAGAGFGLYINSRTRLEGWDVEVAFRRLGERLRERNDPKFPASGAPGPAPAAGSGAVSGREAPEGAPPPPLPLHPGQTGQGAALVLGGSGGEGSAVRPPPFPPRPSSPPPLNLLAMLLLAAGTLLGLGGPLRAAEVDLQESRRQIREVMAHPDFIRQTEKYSQWVPDAKSASSPPPSGPETKGWDWSWMNFSFLRDFFRGDWTEVALRLFLTLLVLALVAGISWGIYRNRRALLSLRMRPERSGPRTVMGLEVLPESLPPDVSAEAWELWSRGQKEAALRLLYRGALAWLVERGALPIRESDTEGDCLRHASSLEDKGRGQYFAGLTSAWLAGAYGHCPPEAETMRGLCRDWPFALSGESLPETSFSVPASSRQGAAALLLMAAVFTLTGCGHFEQKERTLGFKGEARRDPWLAAARFLRLNQYGVNSMRGLVNLPDQSTELIVPADAIGSAVLANIALSWARDGGHLIYLTHGGEIQRDDWNGQGGFSLHDQTTATQPLLEALGLSLKESGRTPKVSEVNIGSEVFKVSLGESETLDTTSAKYPADVTAGPPDQAALVSLRCGQGRVTVLTNAHALRNRWIDDDDHAALLLGLTQLEPHISAVRFVRAGRVNLWDMLVTYAWMAMIPVALALLFWLWRYLPRFGPVRALSIRSQRRFATHLEEAGHFFWKQRMAGALLEAPRQAVLSAARRLSLKESDRHFLSTLCERSGLPENRVRDAMQGGEVRDARALTRQMADLQQILRSL